jgi:hypothetical protein
MNFRVSTRVVRIVRTKKRRKKVVRRIRGSSSGLGLIDGGMSERRGVAHSGDRGFHSCNLLALHGEIEAGAEQSLRFESGLISRVPILILILGFQ